jgi:hypothetical protein
LETLKAAVEKHAPRRPPAQQASRAEPYDERIRLYVAQGLGPRAIYDRLRLEEGERRGLDTTHLLQTSLGTTAGGGELAKFSELFPVLLMLIWAGWCESARKRVVG